MKSNDLRVFLLLLFFIASTLSIVNNNNSNISNNGNNGNNIKDNNKIALWHHLITATKLWSNNFIKEYKTKFDTLAQNANVSQQCKRSVFQTFAAISDMEDWALECKSNIFQFIFDHMKKFNEFQKLFHEEYYKFMNH